MFLHIISFLCTIPFFVYHPFSAYYPIFCILSLFWHNILFIKILWQKVVFKHGVWKGIINIYEEPTFCFFLQCSGRHCLNMIHKIKWSFLSGYCLYVKISIVFNCQLSFVDGYNLIANLCPLFPPYGSWQDVPLPQPFLLKFVFPFLCFLQVKLSYACFWDNIENVISF